MPSNNTKPDGSLPEQELLYLFNEELQRNYPGNKLLQSAAVSCLKNVLRRLKPVHDEKGGSHGRGPAR